MDRGEEGQVCRFVRRVFGEFVAPLYSEEGVREFLRYVDEDAMAERAEGEHCVLVAEAGTRLVGAIEIMDNNHLSLLFVARDFQRQGIARELLSQALKNSQRLASEPQEVIVHSSPNAVTAYEKLGFRVAGATRVENGIRYVPMRMRLPSVLG